MKRSADLPGRDKQQRPTFRYWGGAAILGPLIMPLIPERVRDILWVRAIKAFSQEMRVFPHLQKEALKKPSRQAE